MSKALVIIHGAGKAPSDFYKQPLGDLTARLGFAPPCLPVWYGNLYNVGGDVMGPDAALLPEERQFRDQFVEMLVQRRKAVESTMAPGELQGSVMDSIFLVSDLIRDVMGYVFTDKQFQQQVQALLRDKLLEAAAKYDESVLISHSLGTVIAYDVMAAGADQFNARTFYTTGSPILKTIVLGARTGESGKITPQSVRAWHNVFDTTDVVADPISPRIHGYAVDDIFVNVADAPIPSHDYWNNARTMQMIADSLR